MATSPSGFLVTGQARDIQQIRTRRGNLYMVTRNDERPLIFRATPAPRSVAAGMRE